MVKKNDLSGYRILIIAIAVSLLWHIFWLSAVKIVSSPMPRSPVKFSKVSFLGPILTGVGMEVRASPVSRSMLERRYRKMAGEVFYDEYISGWVPDSKYDGKGPAGGRDQKLSYIIDQAALGEKLEPDYAAE